MKWRQDFLVSYVAGEDVPLLSDLDLSVGGSEKPRVRRRL